MNSSDSEIVLSLLAGRGYARTPSMADADVLLINTCSVREAAEAKVMARLLEFRAAARARRVGKAQLRRPIVGVLGCMAERLKGRLLTAGAGVDLVVGPDAYRDLPRLVEGLRAGELSSAASTALSFEETYADVRPVREAGARAALVTVMRGCSNMCSFCIVPHTRGRERSRPLRTIEDEVRRLRDEGVREVTLLGQNVNSYHDRGEEADREAAVDGGTSAAAASAAAAAAAAAALGALREE